MKTKIILLFFFTCLSQILMAQIIDQKKYLARAKEVDAEIMNSGGNFFASNHVPEKYNNASAVILAKKIDILATKTATGYSNWLTVREKVKIQDRNALDEYSTFSFSKVSKQSNFYAKAAYTYLGISVIKPDGSIKKIDVSQEAVQDQSEDGKEKLKVAIPGLQVGDIIDFYSRVEKKFTSEIPQLDLVLAGEYPIVVFGVSTKIWKDFAVIYSVDNGAPKPVHANEGDYIQLNMQMADIPKSPDDLWVYNKRELPVFKLNFIPSDSKSKEKDYIIQKGKVLNGIPQNWVDQQLSSQLINKFRVDLSEELLKQVQKNITQLKNTRWKQYNKDSIISYLYYYGRFAFLYDYMRDDKIQIGMERNESRLDYRFYGFFIAGLKAYDIDFDFIATVPRHSGTLKNIVSLEDLHYIIKAKGSKEYFIFPPTIYSSINTFPYAFEGQQAYVYNGIFNKGKGASVETTLPTSQASLNQSKEQIKISIDKANPSQLNIVRTKMVKGHQAYDAQVLLTLFEEYADTERLRLGERSFADEVVARVGKRKSDLLLQEYGVVFKEARKMREEMAVKEIENSFGAPTAKIKSLKILKTGNRDNEEFLFTEEFTLDGIIKKAGPNYVITVANLFGSQLQVLPHQRTRSQNIHMSYARNFIYEVEFLLPDGYTVEGHSNIEKHIVNETGSFTCKTQFTGNLLKMNISKEYKNIYEPLRNWEKMLQFLDAAYDVSQQKLLIKKQS